MFMYCAAFVVAPVLESPIMFVLVLSFVNGPVCCLGPHNDVDV
jgi:hypothetical protein